MQKEKDVIVEVLNTDSFMRSTAELQNYQAHYKIQMVVLTVYIYNPYISLILSELHFIHSRLNMYLLNETCIVCKTNTLRVAPVPICVQSLRIYAIQLYDNCKPDMS